MIEQDRPTLSEVTVEATVERGGDEPSAEPGATTFSTPLAALHHDEYVRTRALLVTILWVVVPTLLALPAMPGDHALKIAFAVAIAVGMASIIAFLLYIRDERRFSPAKTLVPASVMLLVITVATLYFGVFSAAQAPFLLGIYYFGLSQSGRVSAAFLLGTALVEALAIVCTALGVIPDRGLIGARGLALSSQLALLCLLEILFVVTYLYGRASRRSVVFVTEGLDLALRQLGQRDAQLEEANRDLELALRGGRPGRYIDERVGSWRLIEVIGRGAMGEVYRAAHVDDGRPAAVKILFGHGLEDSRQVRRFLREAEIASKLDSPHVVAVYETSEGGEALPYIAMELLEGADLSRILRKRRRLPLIETVELVQEVAAALEQARAHAIVHRDLKPQNLFLARVPAGPPLWKVLDFGVSKLGTLDGTLTRGHTVGTPGYMAPEQASGGPIDHRADVFALAVIAYRALTGRPPFSGDDYPKVMFSLVYRQPVRPGEIAELPSDIDAVLALGLAKDPGQRFTTALELAEAVAAAGRGALPQPLRDRAGALLERAPWGARLD